MASLQDAYGYALGSQKHLVLEAMGAFDPRFRDWWSAWDLAAVIHSVHGGDVIRFLKSDGWQFDEDERTSTVTGKRYKVWKVLGQQGRADTWTPEPEREAEVQVHDDGQTAFVL